jgi:glycosyltransferase involved in cell wall biosynthesis
MKIAIEGFYLMMPRTGMGNYLYSLVCEMMKIAPENRYYLYDMPLGDTFYRMVELKTDLSNIDEFTNLSKIPFPFLTLTRMVHLFLSRMRGDNKIRIEEVDILWGPAFRGISRESFKTVITIHDMAHEYYPEYVPATALRYLKRGLPETAKRVDIILAVSGNTKEDIVRFLDVPEEKVKVIYLGISRGFHPVSDTGMLDSVRKRYNLPERFILYVGAIQPRKNITGLIKAYHRLCTKEKLDHLLVIGGPLGWKSRDMFRLIKECGISKRIIFTGYIEEADLPAIYSLADVFVFPSFYEGFGLPVVEAMACGVPVVTSNVSSLPEVTGDAAFLVNPYSTDDLAQGIRQVFSDNDLRQNLIKKGLERVKLFTWERCAREILKVFEELVDCRHS